MPRILIAEDFLVPAGFRVTIVTPQPIAAGLPRRRNPPRPRPGFPRPARCGPPRRRDALAPGMPARACKHWVKHVAFIPDTFVYWALRAAQARRPRRREAPPDLVLTSSPQESSHWIGWQLKKRFGCRWMADFRDGWTFEPHRPDAAAAAAAHDRAPHGATGLEHADWITAATRPIAEDFQRRFPSRRDGIHFLPSGFEEVPLAPEGKDDSLFRTGLHGPIRPLAPVADAGRFPCRAAAGPGEQRAVPPAFSPDLGGRTFVGGARTLKTPLLADRTESLGISPMKPR